MKVHELLATPDKWTQMTAARDGNGNPISWMDEEAVRWCLYGAICKIYGTGEPYRQIRKKVVGIVGGESFVDWNDDPSRSHAEVLALCKELDI